ncbi:MAG: AcrB/AcrD/AcrF family protein [Gemmatimonadetes bacterium]|nr:AcrB/AcrD/AcrF family protein [Gemmatimonadota bacterium]
MWFTRISLKNPVFATMVMLAIVVLGLFSYQRLKVDQFPNIDFPVVVVTAEYPGASPEIVESEVTKKIEEGVNSIAGINALTSRSYESQSVVIIEFQLHIDGRKAAEDVREKIASIRPLFRTEVKEPRVLRFDPSARAIWSLAVLPDSGKGTAMTSVELTNWADQVLKKRLENVRGVGSVTLVGGTKREINVYLNPAAMESLGITADQVVAAVRNENQDLPVGAIRSLAQERVVQIDARMQRPEDFGKIIVARKNGAAVRVDQVARISDGAQEIDSLALYNGQRTLLLTVQKSQDENTIEVVDGLKKTAAEMTAQLPPGVRLEQITDGARPIRVSVENVRRTLIEGALLTVLIVFLFLNSWRSTVITGLTLPISIIGTFLFMNMFGFTINMVTLMALSLCVGLLIDDAIVVRENIVRHLEMGKDHFAAAREGTDEIGLAVMATSFAVIAVFFPVAFMGGMIGKIFFQFGVTVAFAVLVSLFVSFTLDPMLSSIWMDPEVEHASGPEGEARIAEQRKRANPVRRVAFAFNDWFERVADRYPGWLTWALSHRLVMLAMAASTVVASFIILPRLGFTWMPDVNGDEFNVGYKTPPGSRLEYTLQKGRDIVAMLQKQPETDFTYLTVGGGFRGTPNNGQIFVRLKHDRKKSLFEIQGELRGKLRAIPGIKPAITGQQSIFGGRGQPIRVNVQGPELSRLKIAAARVLEVMKDVPGIAEPNSTDEGDIPGLDVQVDRAEAWRAGLGVGAVAATLQPLFAGQRATTWEDAQGFNHDVVVVFPDSLRTSAADVAQLPVASTSVGANGMTTMVPLSQVADVRAGVGPQQIERRQLEQQVQISAGVLPNYAMGDVAANVEKAIDAMGLPPGYHAVFGGDVQNLNETKGYVLEALMLAVVFIYLILASLFGSFLQPLAIMLALPLSFIGVALALLITKGNMNVMTMIGIIMLMGLVTKNGILLVDFANQRRELGDDREHALLTAGRIRLRPIIMTTVAMIFGMIPLALAIGAGAEQRAPMARAVIGGLITSTLLTLFVVPVVYTILDDLSAWVLGRWGASHPHGTAPEILAPARD